MKIVKDTPFEFGFIPWQIRPPAWSLVVVVKGTYAAVPDGTCADAPVQRPVNGEVYWDDDPALSLRYDTDFAVFKPRGECYLAGTAHAPNGNPTAAVEVGFRVGPVYKSLLVTGDRHWSDGGVAGPEPFTAIPLRWERAFGGDGVAQNPTGVGLRPVDTPSGPRRLLPNIENPAARVGHPSDRPAPWGAFPLATTWEPRARRAGTYDARWLRTRWPWLPDDLDWRFYNAAPDDQQIEGYWRGDEDVAWQHLHPTRTRVLTRLPGEAARCFALLRRGDDLDFREVPLRLDTIVVDGDAESVVCTWRGAVEVGDEKLSDVESLFFAREPVDTRRTLAEYRAWYERRVQEMEAEDAALEAEDVPEEPEVPDAPALPEPPSGIPAEGLALLAAMRAQSEQLRGPEPQKAEMLDAFGAVTQDELSDDAPEAETPPLGEIKARARSAQVELPEELEKLPENVEPPADELAELESPEEPLPPTRDELIARHARGEGFADMDLTGADLSALDLRGADFTGAILAGASFHGSALDGCKLDKAVLSGANLAHARLPGASLAGADLTEVAGAGASLEGATLDGAVGAEGEWVGANFRGASLKGAELVGGNFEQADFEGAVLEGADLSRSRCAGARFAKAVMKDCWFEGVRAPKAVFDEADLTGLRAAEGSDFTDATFRAVRGAESKWERSALVRADFTGSLLERADFTGAGMVQANFTRCAMRGVRMQEAVLVAAQLLRVDAFEGNFEGADLSHVDARGANLFGAQLWRANTTGAVLDLAELGRTHLDRRRT